MIHPYPFTTSAITHTTYAGTMCYRRDKETGELVGRKQEQDETIVLGKQHVYEDGYGHRIIVRPGDHQHFNGPGWRYEITSMVGRPSRQCATEQEAIEHAREVVREWERAGYRKN